jgi:sporulation protein YlmC with PRC-barrel domain
MLRNVRDLYGYRVQAADGGLGKIHDILFDDLDWQVRYLVVDIGGLLPGRRVPISPEALVESDWQGEVLSTGLTIDQVRNSPGAEANNWLPSRDQEAALRRYYGWPVYWAVGNPLTAVTSGTPLQATTLAEGETPAARPSSPPPQAGERPLPILRSARRLIGYRVEANDGRVGSIDDLLLDEETWAVRYLVVEVGRLLPGKKVLVSAHWILRVDWDGKVVHLDLAQESVRSSPEYGGGGPVAREYETELFDHYGRPKYWRE